MHDVHIVLCYGAKRVFFYQQVIRMLVINPYQFIKFYTSKNLGKRVTQTCMPYCYVWAEVVYCGFPKSKVFTQNFNMPIPCVSPKSISLPSFICGCTPVSEIRKFKQTKKKK